MVKRLRHHPFTVVSRVRISVGSPSKPLRLLEESHYSAKYRRTKVRGLILSHEIGIAYLEV